MKTLALALSLCLSLPLAAQARPDTPQRAREIRKECLRQLKELDGLASVGVAGIKNQYSLLIVCRTETTREAAREILGGDRYLGLKILWTIAPLRSALPKLPKLLKDNSKPNPAVVPADEGPPWKVEITDCDIIRNYLGLKPVRRRRASRITLRVTARRKLRNFPLSSSAFRITSSARSRLNTSWARSSASASVNPAFRTNRTTTGR